MKATLLRRSLRLQKRALVGWSIALLGLILVTLATWPSVRDQGEAFQAAIEGLPDAMKAFLGDLSDLTTGPGFVRGRLFGLMLPLLLAIHAIGRGADTVAGEEERGALDLLLAQPISRPALVLQKAAAVAVAALALHGVVLVLLAAGDLAFGLGLHWGRMAVTVGMLYAHTLAVAAIALGVGAATGRKTWASATAASVTAGGFILQGLANLTPTLDGLRYASTFHYYGGGQTLTSLDALPGMAVLLGVAGVCLVAGLAAFGRRDIAVA